MSVSHRLIAWLLSAPLLLVACGGAATSAKPTPSGEHSMMMQQGAENMKVRVGVTVAS